MGRHPGWTRLLRGLDADSGLPPVTLRGLRHGAATLALAAGTDLKIVQDQLGHSTITLSADSYTSVLPETAAPPRMPPPPCCSLPGPGIRPGRAQDLGCRAADRSLPARTATAASMPTGPPDRSGG